MRQFTIGRLRGRFCVYWNNEDGKRIRLQLQARTPKEAEAEAIDVVRAHSVKNGTSELSVKDLWKAYIADLAERPTAKTMTYTGKAVLEHFGHLKPDQITNNYCKAYAEKRMQHGISQGSVHTELGHLRSTLNWAVKERLIEFAPHIGRPSKPTPKERYLTKYEVESLIASSDAPHIALAIHLLFATAARVGAILDLKWDKIDLDRRVINLRIEGAATRKGRAIVPINDGLLLDLKVAYESALSDYAVEWAGNKIGSIRKGFEGAVKRSGLHDVTLHTIRHSAAVEMVSNGVPIEKVSQYLGHSNVAITFSTYARFAPSHLQDAAAVLDLNRPMLKRLGSMNRRALR